jgi:hypothetical protein
MVSPNNLELLAERPAFTRHDAESGTGWILLQGDKKHRAFRVPSEPQLAQDGGALTVSFAREIPGLVRQDIGYCALPSGEVAVFSRWQALKDIAVAELVDHPFRWVEIDQFISKPDAKQTQPNVWNIDGILQIRTFAAASGELAKDGLNGSVRRNFSAKANEVLQDSVCFYQPLALGRAVNDAKREAKANTVHIGAWHIQRQEDGRLLVKKSNVP